MHTLKYRFDIAPHAGCRSEAAAETTDPPCAGVSMKRLIVLITGILACGCASRYPPERYHNAFPKRMPRCHDFAVQVFTANIAGACGHAHHSRASQTQEKRRRITARLYAQSHREMLEEFPACSGGILSGIISKILERILETKQRRRPAGRV